MNNSIFMRKGITNDMSKQFEKIYIKLDKYLEKNSKNLIINSLKEKTTFSF